MLMMQGQVVSSSVKGSCNCGTSIHTIANALGQDKGRQQWRPAGRAGVIIPLSL